MDAPDSLAWARPRPLHRAVVLYDPDDATTREMAAAIAQGIEQEGISAEVVDVVEAGPSVPGAYDLIVIGSPSGWLGASPNIRKFLHRLTPADVEGRYVFAYETRHQHRPGQSARRIDAALERLGAEVTMPPVTTFVAEGAGASPEELPPGRKVGEPEFEEIGRNVVRSVRHELLEAW